MDRLTLGRSDLKVTDWCLGTMTFGTHTPAEDAHRQMDMARDAGIDFLDCAEMYPVNPVAKDTVGLSEEVLGDWFARTGRRDEWVVATKISGDNGGFVRDGEGYGPHNIADGIDGSLRRLKTDVIDLYQMHWPLRGSYAFRQNWTFDPSGQDRAQTLDHMHAVLRALGEAVQAGKIRAIGMSNESAWGMTKWCDLAEEHGLPRMVSVQNEYSLLYRLFDTDAAEMAVNEDITLLSFSPLACGMLTGKYQNGARPEGSRMAINGDLGGRNTDRVYDAVQAYLDIAVRHDLDPVHMALAWQRTRPFAVSAIFGATTSAQLERTLAGRDVTLSEAVLDEIDTAHRAHPMPY
ncbi:aldo/keto reductase [Salipiger sp. IMCC34102]|uniref:aldo/keto reductase n=1 Tax=Salipiger sp. IMCC34102 TaxID=2510647 RepID=UPI00101D86B6|nr:aldo/keto reductase [Salipiger sp. IMCC34102]RYH01936.1 aldo/keto reductase [Salipiger sp. IMCC34102]